jgi:hypothetical protein
MPVTRRIDRDVVGYGGREMPVQRLDDAFAAVNGERSPRTEIVLDIDDEQGRASRLSSHGSLWR